MSGHEGREHAVRDGEGGSLGDVGAVGADGKGHAELSAEQRAALADAYAILAAAGARAQARRAERPPRDAAAP